jgi:hypothetical protein
MNYAQLYPNTHVKGFETVMANLNAEIAKIKGASLKGLIECAIEVRRDTEKTPIKTPVDLGNLRASWFVVTAKGKEKDDQWNTGFRNDKSSKRRKTGLEGNAAQFMADRTSAIAEMSAKARSFLPVGKVTLIMGYSANYAVYVHENIRMHDPTNPYWVNRIAKGKGWRPGSGAKWFQEAVYKNSAKMLGIIRKNIQL